MSSIMGGDAVDAAPKSPYTDSVLQHSQDHSSTGCWPQLAWIQGDKHILKGSFKQDASVGLSKIPQKTTFPPDTV